VKHIRKLNAETNRLFSVTYNFLQLFCIFSLAIIWPRCYLYPIGSEQQRKRQRQTPLEET